MRALQIDLYDKHLLCKQRRSVPGNKNLGMVPHTCSLRTGEVETKKDPWLESLTYLASSWAVRTPVSMSEPTLTGISNGYLGFSEVIGNARLIEMKTET